MKNSVRALLLLCAMMSFVSYCMHYPLSIIKGCRPVVRAVCYQRKLDLEVVHHIAKQHSRNEVIPYLAAVADGYKKVYANEDLRLPVTMPNRLQAEFNDSIRRYRAFSFARGCAAGMIAPTMLFTTIGCGACAAVGTAITPVLLIMSISEYEKFSDIASYAAGTFIGVPVLIVTALLMAGTTSLLFDVVENNIFKNQQLVRNNIKCNTDILEQYIQQKQKEDL